MNTGPNVHSPWLLVTVRAARIAIPLPSIFGLSA